MSLVANPVLPGCHPDPSICRVGDDFYLVTSTFEYFPGLPVFHSTDLASWDCIGHVVDREGQLDYSGIASSGGLYAPTIRHHDGTFYVVCTLVDQANEAGGGNFLMTATDPAGPWSDPVWLGIAGIDPSVFFDDDGRAWLHGTRLARDPEWHDQTEVWVRELDLATMSLTGPEYVIWNGAVRGAVWAEGPHLYKVDGRYYLLAAEGGTEFHHAVSVARSDAVTGPYVGNRANPVLSHRQLGHGADVVGTGHADLVQAPDGSWWAVLLGMRPYGGYHYPLGRETFLVPVSWEDGWPVFAPGVGRVPPAVEVPFAGAVRPCPRLDWTALREPAATFAERDGDAWTMHLRPATLADVATPAFLGIRQQHRDLDFGVTLGGRLLPGEEAGIAVRQSERDHVRLAIVPSGDTALVRATHRRAGTDVLLGEVALPGNAGRVRLGVRVRGPEYALWVRIGDRDVVVATADGRTLDSVATGGFLGLWLGVYATSNAAPSDSVIEVDDVAYDVAGPTT